MGQLLRGRSRLPLPLGALPLPFCVVTNSQGKTFLEQVCHTPLQAWWRNLAAVCTLSMPGQSPGCALGSPDRVKYKQLKKRIPGPLDSRVDRSRPVIRAEHEPELQFLEPPACSFLGVHFNQFHTTMNSGCKVVWLSGPMTHGRCSPPVLQVHA